jgi:hypothetical protein
MVIIYQAAATHGKAYRIPRFPVLQNLQDLAQEQQPDKRSIPRRNKAHGNRSTVPAKAYGQQLLEAARLEPQRQTG